MPNKPNIPIGATRLPKGHKRSDYTDEALAEMDRNRSRKYQREFRKRARHQGRRDVTLNAMREDARALLRALAEFEGTSQTKLVERLIYEEARKHERE